MNQKYELWNRKELFRDFYNSRKEEFDSFGLDIGIDTYYTETYYIAEDGVILGSITYNSPLLEKSEGWECKVYTSDDNEIVEFHADYNQATDYTLSLALLHCENNLQKQKERLYQNVKKEL
jgi:hypothetical protein